MEKKKWDVVLLAHILIILWALLFFPSLLLHDGGKIAGALAGGNLAGLFISRHKRFFVVLQGRI